MAGYWYDNYKIANFCSLSVQHVEIYLDKLRDLLSEKDEKLEIKTTSSDNKQKVWVKNLTSHKVENFSMVSDVTTAF